jgi:integrase
VRLDDKATWDAIRRVREELKLPKFSMHDLRRAWASAMHANGASIKQVSVWLGHSTTAVTERYVRIFSTESTGHEFLPR